MTSESYTLPNLVLPGTEADAPGSPGEFRFSTLAQGVITRGERQLVNFVNSIDGQVEHLHQLYLSAHQKNKENTAVLHAAMAVPESPPGSPLLTSMSSLKFPPAGGNTSTGSGVALPPSTHPSPQQQPGAPASPLSPTVTKNAKDSDIEGKIGANIKTVKVSAEAWEKIRKANKDVDAVVTAIGKVLKAMSREEAEENAAASHQAKEGTEKKGEGDETPPPAETKASEAEGTAAEEAEKKDAKVRKTLVEIQIPCDTGAIQELSTLETEADKLTKVLEDISKLLQLRSSVLSSRSQARSLVDAIDEAVSEVAARTEDYSDFLEDFLRARADLEKCLIKHPASEAIYRRLVVQSKDIWDSIEDAYRTMIYDLMHLKFLLTKDLPVIAEVLSMEGDVGGMTTSGGGEMMFM